MIILYDADHKRLQNEVKLKGEKYNRRLQIMGLLNTSDAHVLIIINPYPMCYGLSSLALGFWIFYATDNSNEFY